MHIKAKDEEITSTAYENNSSYIERFCNPSELTIEIDVEAPEKAMTAVVYRCRDYSYR